MTIAILCPTRDRVPQLKRMIASAATDNVVVYVYTTYDDPVYDQYEFLQFMQGVKVVIGTDYPTVHKWNFLAEYAMKDGHDLMMLGADDMYFGTPGWDAELLRLYDNKPHVYALQDSRDVDGTPHPIVTREYIDKLGYFLPPIYFHWFCDSWTVEIAKANNCFTHLREYILFHDKPSDWGRADETHKRIRDMGWHKRDTYVNDKMRHLLELEKERLK